MPANKPPRGLKSALKSSSPVKLTGSGRFKGFQLVSTKRKLAGLTKRLEQKVFSAGIFSAYALKGSERRRGWAGSNGGIRRGKAVDSQLTRFVNAGKTVPKKGMYSLTKLALLTLKMSSLVPVMAQRGCCSQANRVATACDLVCYDVASKRIVVVEVKCGFSGSRTCSAIEDGKECRMHRPLDQAMDCFLNRHMAQLAATTRMLQNESELMKKVSTLGINCDRIDGALLYLNEEKCDLFRLNSWWRRRSQKIVDALA